MGEIEEKFMKYQLNRLANEWEEELLDDDDKNVIFQHFVKDAIDELRKIARGKDLWK